MLGFRYIKTPPTTYLLAFRKGSVIAEGAGLSLWYYAPTTTLVAIPIAAQESPFIFEKVTADFQSLTVQGQVSYRIADPVKISTLLNFAVRPDGVTYLDEDPTKLDARVIAITQVLVQQLVQQSTLTEVLRATGKLADAVLAGLRRNQEMAAMGIETLGVAIVAVKPTPETGRALEAKAREAILREADEAIYARRNAAVENERAIKESELDTEVAVEQKKQTIRETQMEAEAAVQRKKTELHRSELEAAILLENRRQELVKVEADNRRVSADSEAYRLAAMVNALSQTDARIVQVLASTGMQPSQLIAQAFGGIAERAEKIGQLNVSPELLQALLPAVPREKARG